MSECIECGEEYSDKRAALGYQTCLKCGEITAFEEVKAKAKQVAVLCHKSGYQYIGNKADLVGNGKHTASY